MTKKKDAPLAPVKLFCIPFVCNKPNILHSIVTKGGELVGECPLWDSGPDTPPPAAGRANYPGSPGLPGLPAEQIPRCYLDLADRADVRSCSWGRTREGGESQGLVHPRN